MKQKADGQSYQLRRVSDFQEDDMVWVGTIRSPSSKGQVSSVSIPHLNRDYRSIVADNIPGSRILSLSGASVPVLAANRVSYKGEPIALIVGPNRQRVAEAVRLSKVVIEEEKPELDFECFDSGREIGRETLVRGDAESILKKADTVLHAEYRSSPQDHYYPEPQGAAASFDYDKLVVYTSTQWPFQVRDVVQSVLGVKPDEVIVRPTLLGPHLDGKLWYPSLLAAHAAIVARLCKKPALLLLSREEDFLYTTKRTPMLCSVQASIDENGKLLAMDARVALNIGAYGPLAKAILERSVETLSGMYACDHVRIRAGAVSTNLPPMGAFAGLGAMNLSFARERLADECATAAGLDPARWRMENLRGSAKKKQTAWMELEQKLLSSSDFGRKHSAYELMRKRRDDPKRASGFGIGLAFAAQPGAAETPGAGARVEVELSKDLRLSIATSALPGTSGTAQVWKAEAANIIGIDEAAVSIAPVSTDMVPDSGPASSSRGVAIISRLIVQACETIRERRFREGLPIRVAKSHRASKSQVGDYGSWAGAVVELRLDPLDRRPIVRGVWIAAKAGRILSQARAEASLARDASVAIGLCLAERLNLSTPASTPEFLGYQLHRLKDKMPIHAFMLDSPEQPYPSGIGELAYLTIPAAYANAMGQALDRSWNTFPGTQEDSSLKEAE